MNGADYMADRLADQAIEAERAVLGAILVDPARYDDAAEVLGAADWFRTAHGLVWKAVGRLVAEGQAVDYLTLKAALGPHELEEVGGASYLAGLMDGVPRASNIGAYARRVRDCALRRSIAATAHELLASIGSGEEDGAAILERGESALIALRSGQPGTTVVDPERRASGIFDTLEASEGGKRRGTLSGLDNLDGFTFGLRPGQLIVLGARPSQGKTALALNLAIAAGTVGPVLFCSLEMAEEQITLRELALRTGIAHALLDAGRVGSWDFGKIANGTGAIADGRISILDKAGATVGQIRGAARRLQATAKQPLALLVVDYLQLMRSERGDRPENRTLEVAQFSAGLKQIARELAVPVVALSQLSRESERRQDKRPILADLRESGALEQDADIVLLLHRPGVYEQTPEDGRAEVVVAKQRNGPTGVAHLKFDPDTMKFSDAMGVVRA